MLTILKSLVKVEKDEFINKSISGLLSKILPKQAPKLFPKVNGSIRISFINSGKMKKVEI